MLVPSVVHINDIEARGGDRISGKKVYHFESPSTKRLAYALDKLLVKNLGTKEVPVAKETLDAKEKVSKDLPDRHFDEEARICQGEPELRERARDRDRKISSSAPHYSPNRMRYL